jgi:hypothetical protein
MSLALCAEVIQGKAVEREAALDLLTLLNPSDLVTSGAGKLVGRVEERIETGGPGVLLARNMEYSRVALLENFSEYLAGTKSGEETIPEAVEDPFRVLYSGIEKRDLSVVQRISARWAREIAKPFWEVRPELAAIQKEIESLPWYRSSARTFLTWVDWKKFALKAAELELDMQLARVALACKLSIRETGSAPSDLKALVPIYLDRVPTDPFTGRALQYARFSEREFLVVGAGPDGKVETPLRPDGETRTDDLGRVQAWEDDQVWQEGPLEPRAP